MQDIKNLILEAKKAVRAADHLLYITYPVVNDKKLFISIVDNLYKANINAMNAILQYERLYKRVAPYPEIFEHKMDLLKTGIAERYHLQREYIVLLEDLKKITEARKASPIEFQRQDKYIICSPNYRMETLTIEKLKNYLFQSKLFVEKIAKIIPK